MRGNTTDAHAATFGVELVDPGEALSLTITYQQDLTESARPPLDNPRHPKLTSSIAHTGRSNSSIGLRVSIEKREGVAECVRQHKHVAVGSSVARGRLKSVVAWHIFGTFSNAMAPA